MTVRDRHAGQARLGAVLLLCVLVGLVVPPAWAAPFSWVRTAAASGVGTYGTLAPAAGAVSGATAIVDSGDGLYVFRPGPPQSRRVGSLTAVPTGDGYATAAVLDGTFDAGTWSVATSATVSGLPAGESVGTLVAVLYASGPGGTRRLSTLRSAEFLATGNGTRSLTMSTSLGRIAMSQERLIVELYLAVEEDDAPGTWQVTIAEGGAGDTVTAPSPLTTRPLVPARDVHVSSAGDRTLTVAWTAATDARVTGYVVQRSTTRAGGYTDRSGVVTATTFADAGLTNGTTYYYRVLATNGATRAAPSNITAGTGHDTAAPQPPASVAVATNGSATLLVTWSASPSSDAVSYILERAAAAGGPWGVRTELGSLAFTETGLPAGSLWHYRVRTVDDDGLISAPSVSAAATVPPNAPFGLTAEGANEAVLLSWDSTDDDVVRYRVERATGAGAFAEVTTTPGTSFTNTGLTNGTTYRYRILAEDSTGGRSSYSPIVSVTPVDRGRPAPPFALTVTPDPARRDVVVAWQASPTSGVSGYDIVRIVDGVSRVLETGNTTRSITDAGLPIGVRYRYQIVSVDLTGRTSLPVEISYQFAPAAPARLRTRVVTETTVDLVWDGVAGVGVTYRVFRGATSDQPRFGARSEHLVGTTFQDAGLVLGQTAFYAVQAYGRDGEPSGPSNVIAVDPVDLPPSAPQGAAADDLATGGTLRVRWLPNPEPDVVTYTVTGAANAGGPFVLVATGLAEATFIDRSRPDGVPYHYRIIAVDLGGNNSPPSSVAVGVPHDTVPPDPPGRPVTEILAAGVRLTWAGSVEAVGYSVGRSVTAGGPYDAVGATATRSFVDTTVTPGVRYYYTVTALDASGNAARSPEATALLPSAATGGTSGGAGSTSSGSVTGRSSGVGGSSSGTSPPPIPVTDPIDFPPLLTTGGSGGTATGNASQTSVSTGASTPEPIGSPTTRLPRDTPLTRAIGLGDLPGVVDAVADAVGRTARTFRLPLVVLAMIALYLLVQGRIDREVVISAVTDDVSTRGEGDDVEFRL